MAGAATTAGDRGGGAAAAAASGAVALAAAASAEEEAAAGSRAAAARSAAAAHPEVGEADMQTRSFLDTLGHERIVKAIQDAEARSRGEVRVHVSRQAVATVEPNTPPVGAGQTA